MNKIEKQELLSKISSLYENNQYIFILNYKGINAKDFFSLRKKLFDSTSDKILVVKNTINNIAVKNLNIPPLVNLNFKDQLALIFTNKPISVANLLQSFVKKELISIHSYSDKATLSSVEDMLKISKFLSEEGLKSHLVGLLQSSYTAVVRLLNQKSSL